MYAARNNIFLKAPLENSEGTMGLIHQNDLQ